MDQADSATSAQDEQQSPGSERAGRRRPSRRVSDLNYRRLGRPRIDAPPAIELSVEGVRCRFYQPEGGPAESGPLHVHAHGGGFVAGSADDLMTDALCARRVNESGVCLLSVDYRLAPEHPFPAGLDDVYRVILAALSDETAVQLGHDPANVSVGGISAGGNLVAASLVLMGPAASTLRGALLEVPALDLDLTHYPRQAPELALYTPAVMQYLPGGLKASLAKLRDPRVSPIEAPDLSHFPPSHLILAGRDPLTPGSLRFADRLRAAGRPAQVQVVEGAIHAALSMDQVWPPAQRWHEDAARAIAAFHGSPARLKA